MTVFVTSRPQSGQRKGDWAVKVGAGRGGRIVSSHRTKSAAMSAGRAEARKRGDVLKAQTTRGQWQTVTSY